MPLDDVLGVLAMNPYHGTWEKSIKRSGLLREETGILELRSFYNSSNLPSNYVLKLLVVDGNYRD